MKLFARYAGWLYLKSFLIVFLSLELFYVGIDLLTNLKDIPSSANLQLLYIGITALTAVSYVLPISLVFGIIISHINMVRSNELVSFYALGISKNNVIITPFFMALFITCIYVGLNFTPFAYAYDYQKGIINGVNFNRATTDSFLKFDGKFIYIKELNPLEKDIKNIVIFDVNQTELNSVTFAKSAYFKDNAWDLIDANITTLPKIFKVGNDGLILQNKDHLNTLKGFSPKSIQSANQNEKVGLSIGDAFDFMLTFKNEGASINSAKVAFYTLTIAPFFAPFLLLIIYYHLPTTGRFFNLALASFIYVLITLITWGILFVLARFSATGVIVAELGIVLPVICILSYALYLLKAHR